MHFDSGLNGMQVVGAGGRVLGKVIDVEIDVEKWQVSHLLLRVDSDAVEALELERPFWFHAQVDIPVELIGGLSDVIVLRATADQLAAIVAAARPTDS